MTEFKQGDAVICISRTGIKKRTVFKVYKTGNFVLKKSGNQFNQTGLEAGAWYSGRSRIEHYTPELFEAYAKPIRIRNKIRKASSELKDCVNEKTIDQILMVLESGNRNVSE